MQGANKIEINEATMKDAVNLWLKDQFKNPPNVTSVKALPNNSSGFVISVSSPVVGVLAPTPGQFTPMSESK